MKGSRVLRRASVWLAAAAILPAIAAAQTTPSGPQTDPSLDRFSLPPSTPTEPAADADLRSDHCAAQPPDSRRADHRGNPDAHPERGGDVAGTDPCADCIAHPPAGSDGHAAYGVVADANTDTDGHCVPTRYHPSACADRQSDAGGDRFGPGNGRTAVGRMADRPADRDRRGCVGAGSARRFPPWPASKRP